MNLYRCGARTAQKRTTTMNELILCKYGEIVLKGLNRSGFETELLRNVRRRLKGIGEFKVYSMQSTMYVEPASPDADIDEAYSRIKKVFGITKISRAAETEKSIDAMFEACMDYLGGALAAASTFKVEAKRSDKRFPLTSPEISAEIGGRILEKFCHLKVDVKNPQVKVVCEVRDRHAYVHALPEEGAGGMPVGSSGRALLLLSGGIDSPVAGTLMAKRGVIIGGIHFQSPPYTSERALLKVESLAKIMSEYCGRFSFYCVPFTKIQEAIRDNCPEELFTLIMRRLMMKVAQKIALSQNFSALITGESLGQVASQTLAAMVTTDAVCEIPVFRPCIGMDKKEIIDCSYKIGTFDTSILPYEDCCTVFTPKHPKTRPTVLEVEQAEQAFNFEPLIEEAVLGTTVKTFNPYE